MIRFFVEGGIWYMGILSMLFLVILSLTVTALNMGIKSRIRNGGRIMNLAVIIRSVALFTLVVAIFGQILGLVDIFDYLAHKDSQVAAPVLARGIKITFWPTIYGIIIYLLSILFVLGLRIWINPDKQSDD